MKNLLRVMAILMLIFGIIGSFSCAYTMGQDEEYVDASSFSLETKTTRDWPTTVGVFVGVLFSTAISATIMFSIVKVLDNQEKILIGQNGQMVMQSNGTGEFVPNNMWKCPQCGKVNANFSSFCTDCGVKKA